MEEWRHLLLSHFLAEAEIQLLLLDSCVEKCDSWLDIALLMEASDHFGFLRQAYENKHNGTIHVEVNFITE